MADPSEYDRGAYDGTHIANRLPLTAFAELLGSQFDVVRWLEPWRNHWSRLAGNHPSAAPLPSWLPDLAQYLGGYAAPSGATNSSFTPSPTYLAGFCVGLGQAWNKAAGAGLVPADGYTLTRWITQPGGELTLQKPPADATLNDLRIARRRNRRARLIWWTLRALLWTAIALLLLMEIAAIAITIDGGWTDADGTPADDQTALALIANLGCLLPLIGLVGIAVVDVYVSRRKQRQRRFGGY